MTHPAYRGVRMNAPPITLAKRKESPMPKAKPEFERPDNLPRASRFTREDAETALVILAESKLGARFLDALDLAAALRTCATTVHNVAVNDCNGYHSADVEALDERRKARAIAKAEAWLAPHGIKLRTGGDPRGACFFLMTPESQRHNTWGGAESGWAVT